MKVIVQNWYTAERWEEEIESLEEWIKHHTKGLPGRRMVMVSPPFPGHSQWQIFVSDNGRFGQR